MTSAPRAARPHRPRLIPRVLGLARVLIAVLPLYWISSRVAWSDVLRQVLSTHPAVVLAALVAPLVSIVFAAVRWRYLLQAYGAAQVPSTATLFRLTLIGTYFNVLPGAVAGDAVRGYRTQRLLANGGASYAVVLAERVCGLIALVAIGAAAMLWPHPQSQSLVFQALGIGFAASLALSLALFALPLAIRKWGARVPGRRAALIRALAQRVPAPQRSGPVLAALAVSLLTQGAAMAQILVLVWSLAPSAPVLGVLQLLPAAILLTYVPVTPGAVGQREMVFAYLLKLVGVPPSSAVAAGLMVFGASMVIAAVGGLVNGWDAIVRSNPSLAPPANPSAPAAGEGHGSRG